MRSISNKIINHSSLAQLPLWLNQAPLISHQGQLKVQVPLKVEITPEIGVPQSVCYLPNFSLFPLKDFHPDNLVILVPANSQTRTQKKLMWSGPMEMMMLDLYAKEVSKELQKYFTECQQIQIQTQPGLQRILSLQRCKRIWLRQDQFRTQMLKDSREHLSLSFGIWTLSLVCMALPGKQLFWLVSDSLNYSCVQEGLVKQMSLDLECHGHLSGFNKHKSKCLSFPVSYKSLVGFLNLQTNKLEAHRSASQPSSINANDKKTNIQQAMALYQEVHAPHASNKDSLAAFKIFCNNINAQIFTSITNDGLRTAWLQEQIQESNQLCHIIIGCIHLMSGFTLLIFPEHSHVFLVASFSVILSTHLIVFLPLIFSYCFLLLIFSMNDNKN
ncbi:uncharacterized protein VP01_2169g1 [Puccinia sorghi]|uniref:Uncharacterized protein n=1 Tax=Puccinia sorghi TaxID=27349 RepID=A0A0L6V9H2_9BASI|nr:uncharacterized protein VP01_2169g1 [Puccinia sorghi]